MLDTLMNASYKVAHIRFRYNIFPSVILSKLLGRKLNKVEKGLTEYDLLVDLPYLTVRMNDALSNLSALAKSNDVLRHLILDGSADTTSWSLFPEFQKAYNEFMQCFGWKSTASYIAFSSTSWNENPDLLVDVLKLSMKSKSSKTQINKYKTILAKVNTTFNPQTAAKMINQVEQIRAYHINREESLYLLETCFGLSRRIIYEIENRFSHIFLQHRDILFLTVDEVKGLIWKEQEEACHKAIERRKKMRIYNDALWNEIEISAKGNEAGVLKGSTGNRGTVKARARVILSLDGFHLMQPGEVLVCRYTDPSWTPLFPLAAAVVSDTGGPLSHSAIVAREYGIPAVLGCGNATKLIQSGDVVLVDGDNGRVIMSQ
ncbi:MAG: PEP-utilizing enzyme [Lachnospiraceae bacterium]